MSTQLIGLLLILALLIIFLVIGNNYKEHFYELDKDIIARCGSNPSEYIQNNLPERYYWLPNTISYPVKRNDTPVTAILGYEWNKCTGGKLRWNPDDYPYEDDDDDEDDENDEDDDDDGNNFIPVFRKKYKNNKISTSYYNQDNNKYVKCISTSSNNYISCSNTQDADLVIKTPGDYRITSSVNGSTITITSSASTRTLNIHNKETNKNNRTFTANKDDKILINKPNGITNAKFIIKVKL